MPPAKRLIAALSLAVLALAAVVLLAVLGLLAAAVQDKPTVAAAAAVSGQDITRAMQLLQRHDPRGKLPGITRQIELGDRDLTLLALYAGRRLGEPRVTVKLHPAWAQVQASLALPSDWLMGPLDGWLNVELRLAEQRGLPAIDSLRVGQVPAQSRLAPRRRAHIACGRDAWPGAARRRGTAAGSPPGCDRVRSARESE